MAQKDVVITYETLFELLRIEKTREELQQLDENFFDDLLVYLGRKKASFENKESQAVLFAQDERQKAMMEFENIRKILKDLYDRREKKIVNMALSKARTGISVVNTANMLPSEIILFDAVNSTLLEFRKNVLFKLASGETPIVSLLPDNVMSRLRTALTYEVIQPDPQDEDDELRTNDGPIPTAAPAIPEDAGSAYGDSLSDEGLTDDTLESESAESGRQNLFAGMSDEPKELKTSPDSGENTASFKKVRFLTPIEEIVGPDLQIYGPYDAGAVISLPNELARVLLEKQQAEEA